MKKLILKLLLACVVAATTINSFGITVLLNENFSSGSMPSGWSQDSAGTTPFYPWTFNNAASRIITGASFDANFVIMDSDNDSSGHSQDVYLNLPAVDASALSSLFLIMDQQYRDYVNGFHQIEVSTNSGASWTHIVSDSDLTSLGYPNPAVRSVYDITAIGAGHSNVRIRFHYAGTWAWWWAIDNVIISDQQPPCISPPYGGHSTSDATVACGTNTFTLNLNSNTTGSGQSYQWQSSPDGITWTDIPGATTIPFVTNQAGATYYRCVVTCSGLTGSSDSVFVRDSPIPGTTVTTEIFPCPSTTPNFTLSLSGASTGGVQYQWQSSPDNINFTDIPSANSATLTYAHTVTTYYRCALSCGLAASYSTSVLVNTNPINGCYCYPYNPICGGTDEITEVVFNTLINTSTCDMSNTYSNYTYYPASTVTTTVDAGSSYNLSVTTGANNIISVWIDYNRNGIYEPSEWNQVCITSTAGNANVYSVVIPSTAFDGITGMRIRSRLASNPNDATSSCLVMGSGETEDYEITIANGIDAVQAITISKPTIYPSPTAGLFYVDLGKKAVSSAITITDAFGRIIREKASVSSSKETIDISGFANGIYFVKVENNNGTTIQRIILNK